jgi:hypothetical protein
MNTFNVRMLDDALHEEGATVTLIIRIGFAAAFAVALCCSVAIAEDADDAAITRACKWDIVKFASAAKKDEIKSILIKNIDKLSSDCRTAIEASK